MVIQMIEKKPQAFLKLLSKIVLIPLSFSLVNCNSEPTKETHVETHVDTINIKQVESGNHNKLPNPDPGKHQSPINIHTLKSHKELKKHQYEVHFKDEVSAVKNLGHTIQLDFNQGSSVIYNGVTYYFKQLHFHTPAEHHIDGIIYPMEMHIVCATDTPQAPSYMVIAVLFKMGQENKFLSEFSGSVPKEKHNTTFTKINQVKLTHFLSLEDTGDLAHHYHYKGSLTTPPYTERVNWVIYKNIFDASNEQIDLINTLEGNNARQIQSDDSRPVEYD
jgi:carbonic anhydrase